MSNLAFTTDGLTPIEEAANNVTLPKNMDKGGFKDAIGCLEQRDANIYQYMFAIDPEWDSEFLVGVKDHERLVRISTPLSSPDTLTDRHIAKVSLKTGRISHIDHDHYADESEVKWQRGIKTKFMAIDGAHLAYFGYF